MKTVKRFLAFPASMMMTLIILTTCNSKSIHDELTIVPIPAQFKITGSGAFTIAPKTIIQYDTIAEKSATYISLYFKKYYDLNVKTAVKSENSGRNNILLNYDPDMTSGQYTLQITRKGIQITGSEDGVFYGLQSLVQLLPTSPTKKGSMNVPLVEISDKPRFAYRGMLLDVSRHFFPLEYLKRCVDYAAWHKLNYFQLHLTDDQGWRIEIKNYPALNETGSWRNGTMIGLWPGKGNDSIRHGGYYTQNELRELVTYARDRYVTLVPEIEMPGHSLAALSSYNYLGCTGGPYEVKETWGASEDVFCAGKETTFEFLQNVLDEVLDIFPSAYIHIGGDECRKDRWEKCSACQQRIRTEGLKDEAELQSYFISRIARYLDGKGRTIIGWDEITEGGAPEGAIIMSWRGGGEWGRNEALRTGHKVILSPSFGFYLDYPQTSREDSLAADWGGVTPLQKTYLYEPSNDSLEASEAALILGGQANIWTEYINNTSKADYMTFPRLSAASEVLWSDPAKKDWEEFKIRLLYQYDRYQMWNISYNKADPDLE